MGRFENFWIGRVCPLLVVVRRLKPLTALSGTVCNRLASSMSDHTPVLLNVFEPFRIGMRNLSWHNYHPKCTPSFSRPNSWNVICGRFDSYSIRTQTADSQVPTFYCCRQQHVCRVHRDKRSEPLHFVLGRITLSIVIIISNCHEGRCHSLIRPTPTLFLCRDFNPLFPSLFAVPPKPLTDNGSQNRRSPTPFSFSPLSVLLFTRP